MTLVCKCHVTPYKYFELNRWTELSRGLSGTYNSWTTVCGGWSREWRGSWGFVGWIPLDRPTAYVSLTVQEMVRHAWFLFRQAAAYMRGMLYICWFYTHRPTRQVLSFVPQLFSDSVSMTSHCWLLNDRLRANSRRTHEHNRSREADVRIFVFILLGVIPAPASLCIKSNIAVSRLSNSAEALHITSACVGTC